MHTLKVVFPVGEALFLFKEMQDFPKKLCLIMVESDFTVIYYSLCGALSSLTSGSEPPRALPAHVIRAPPQSHPWLQSPESRFTEIQPRPHGLCPDQRQQCPFK